MPTHEPSGTKKLPKSIAGIAIIVLAVSALAIGVTREVGRTRASTDSAERAEPAHRPGVVTVYYFHGDVRCPTCRAIEARTTTTIREEYAREVADGRLRFEVVNFDTPKNRHFRNDYDLSFGSVIVQGAGEARPWENLSEVWTLVKSDPLVFQAYLVEHIDHMLDDAG